MFDIIDFSDLLKEKSQGNPQHFIFQLKRAADHLENNIMWQALFSGLQKYRLTVRGKINKLKEFSGNKAKYINRFFRKPLNDAITISIHR